MKSSMAPLIAAAFLPSCLAIAAAPLLPGASGILAGAAAALPINLAALAIGAIARRGIPMVAFIGIVAALAIRCAGALLTAVAVHLSAPALLTPAMATLCVLLLVALVGETLLHARRLLTPSESARV